MGSNYDGKVIRADNGQNNAMANALRVLAMDAVQQANSGHPGAPMGMAEMGVALWSGHLRHNPANPAWPDRDRFVLSNGHASMLLYALLHLTGYDLPMADLQRFRQLHSKTPGHPEVRLTPGVETTTGPLGQGLANAVGFALAEKLLADTFNRPGHTIVDHHSYVFLGDGCLMEGISHEACSMAGAWKLNKLIVLYDDNGISIDGPVEGWFADDTPARFRAYGWNVIGPLDGHDVVAIGQAIAAARTVADAPTLIVCRTTIGKGSPARAGTARAHGEPLGDEEIARSREALDWPHAPFTMPASIMQSWDARVIGARRESQWQARFEAYRADFPALAADFERRMTGDLPNDFSEMLLSLMSEFGQSRVSMASRKASQTMLAALAPLVPELLGGSADLTGSNLTDFPDCGAVRGGQTGGRHINYGVREFGMAAVMNGIALHGGFIPYGGTFLTFSDYSRNAIRMAALMQQRVIHVFTHDSIGLGEDGPTHQPVEHAASLRLIPNLDVWRPCDVAETAVAWTHALQQRRRPSALLLSRQNLPAQTRNPDQVLGIRRGGYVLSERKGPMAVILATGSEVSLAMQAQQLLDASGLAVRVVSIPSSTVFDRQDRSYREAVLGRGLPRIGIEAGVTRWWGQYGCCAALGVDDFGESAPAAQLFARFGLTAQALAECVLAECAQTTGDDATHRVPLGSRQ
jgi:transketolase